MVTFFILAVLIVTVIGFFIYYVTDEYDYMNYICRIIYQFFISTCFYPFFYFKYSNWIHVYFLLTLFLSIFFYFDDYDEEYKKKKYSNFIFYFFMYLLISCVLLFKINNNVYAVILVTTCYPLNLFIFMYHEREYKKIKKLSFKKRTSRNEDNYFY